MPKQSTVETLVARLTAVCLCALGLVPLGATADESLPAPFTAVYKVRALGLSGETTMQFAAAEEPGLYVFRTEARPKGLAKLLADEQTECSRFRYESGEFLPLVYDENDRDRPSRIRFDWPSGAAQSRYREATVTLDLDPGTLDRATEQIVVMHDLAAAEPELGPYRTIERNEYRDIEYRSEGTEEIGTPVGRYDTVRFRRQRVGSSRSVLVWFAPALDWMPVKIEQFKGGKSQATAYLESYQPEAPGRAQARGSVTPVCP